MLGYEWVKNKDKPAVDHTDYFFSDIRDAFRYLAFTLHENEGKNRVGYSVLSISTDQGQTKIKLLDHQIKQQASRNAILALTLNVVVSVMADCIEISEDVAKHMNIGILKFFLL